MDVSRILHLFTLFSGERSEAVAVPLVEGAMAEVRGRLRADADETDLRLCYLCAAVANLRHTEMLAARDRLTRTAAGSVSELHNAAEKFELAEALVSAYRASCRTLLEDTAFCFCNTPCQ